MSLSTSQTAAAFHGIASNRGHNTVERLGAAMQACDLYSVALEQRDPVLNAVEDVVIYLRAMERTLGKMNPLPEPMAALVRAWETFLKAQQGWNPS